MPIKVDRKEIMAARSKAGGWTRKTLEMNEDNTSDDDRGVILPDGNWSRRKHDLY